MAATINASTSAGVVTTADTSGILQLQTNGTAALTVDASQNVGIGTASPAKKLELYSSQNANVELLRLNNPDVNGLGTQIGFTQGSTTYSQIISEFSSGWRTKIGAGVPTGTTAGDAGYLTFFTNNGSSSYAERMRIDSSGNVGIGTSSPTTKLNVNGGRSDFFANSNPYAIGVAYNSAGGNFYIGATTGAAPDLVFSDATPTERMRITASGNVLAGITSGDSHQLLKAVAQGSRTFRTYSTTTAQLSFEVWAVSSEAYSGAASCTYFGRNSSTLRSINAGGTVNASGADYAEYMTKAGDFTVAKGDVVGIDAQGKLTNVFANAVSFVVKSTDPSYVGGDTWGNKETLGLIRPDNDATDEEKTAFDSVLEAARQLVDRIAFAGQVPVNVIGATAGQYIIPINDNGAIKGQAVTSPTFEQYQQAVGKVIAIEADGRARVIVKVA